MYSSLFLNVSDWELSKRSTMPPRRIKKARITHISLVPRGANRMPVLYKQDGSVQFDLLTKVGSDFDEQGELLAVVYVPELRDSQGDIASAKVVKEMMHSFAREGKGIDIRHDGKPVGKDRAFVAEQFLVQKGDSRFDGFKDYDGNEVDVTGAWAVIIKIEDEELRRLYREGQWNGVSMGGVGEVEEEKEGILKEILKALGLANNRNNGDQDMTAEELAKALEKNNESLTKALIDGFSQVLAKSGDGKKESAIFKARPEAGESLDEFTARVLKEQESAKAADILDIYQKAQDEFKRQAPVFKGDPNNPEDVRKHRLAVERWKMSKDVDWTDPESIAKYEQSLAMVDDDDDDDLEKCQTELERQLMLENRRLRKASNQPVGGKGSKSNDSVVMGLSKQDADLLIAGMEWGDQINKSSGFDSDSFKMSPRHH